MGDLFLLSDWGKLGETLTQLPVDLFRSVLNGTTLVHVLHACFSDHTTYRLNTGVLGIELFR